MEVCKVSSKKDFIAQIVKLCNNSAKLGLVKGPSYIKNGITSMIELAKASSEPEQQIQLLKETLNDFYNATNTPYGAYLSRMLTEASKNQLFSEKINPKLAENKVVSSTFEETAKASNQMRQRNFLETKFKGSLNAKLYFQRSMKNDMVETFLVKRSGDNPKYFTSQEDMNLNVRAYKQELLDRIFSYFDGNVFLKNKVKDLPRVMYSDGNYNNTIEQIKSVIDSELSPKAFEQEGVQQLEQYYTNYRDGKNPRDKEFLDAYNAWITLQNFDTIVQDTIGTIIKVNENSNYNKHTGDLVKYEIKGRATNMWNNWTTSDDIADMSEVVSDVTQMLIETSRMYKWGSGEDYPDRYVSFNDFNYVIGKIKKWANDPKSDAIFLNSLEWNEGTKPSIYTQRLMMDILNWNRLNGNLSRNPDGSLSNLPKEVTWKQLISRINENPQRYLHAIFDIMCNSDLLSNFTLNDYEKNLVWSFYKETFGGDGNTRSLYRLHTMTKEDNIYQIITQVAASTFPEDYLQYFEKSNGVISTRLLQDYALENIEKDIVNNLQQTANTLDKETYKEYNVTVIPRRDDDPNKDRKYLNETKLSIPVHIGHDIVASLNIDSTAKSVVVDFPVEYAEQIWNDTKVQKMFKDVLGINFEGDPDLKNAYLETVISPRAALNDLGNLVGRTIFNSIVNNYYIPIPSLNIKDMASLKTFIRNQFGDDKVSEYSQNIDPSNGLIPILSTKVKTAAISNLAMATAINSNLLSQAQSKTGEGTSLANYTLSRMRNFYQNQVEMQCKKGNSAVRDLSFVVNSNNLFEGILSRRELKTLKSNQQSTQFSDQQSFQLSFINDFISGFIPNPEDTAYIKNGRVSFLPTVNSDKTQIDGLLVNLHAKSRISDGKGGFKSYMELTDEEIEKEMELEFKPMYDRIITNINNELTKVYNLLPETFKISNNINVSGSVITKNQAILNALNNAFANDTSLGKEPKERIIKGLHKLTTQYNKTHSRNPIMIASQIHYVFDNNGLLSSNKTLEALWGRFNPDADVQTQNRLIGLYSKERGYIEYAQRNGLGNLASARSMFKYQEHLTIKDLLETKFQVNLFGSNDKVRHDQNEIKFLRGQAEFTDAQKSDPAYAYLRQLNDEMKNWVGADGLMILAKGDIDGQRVAIKTLDQLNQAKNLQIHPMLSKLNRLDYLCSQQYTISTVGSHYAHKGGAGTGSILVEEAQRWLASNKRNVAATSTVHLFQNKQLNGVPSIYNLAIIEDITADLYNVMGDLYLEGHAPLDGGMFVNAWMSILENNSLAGEKAGGDKKQFGTFFSELYGAGGIVKTAGFAPTNDRMRRSKAWQNLQRAMTSKPWVKEFADEFGNDILEVMDITKDYLGNTIDYTQAIKGQPIMYKRPAHDNPKQLAAYRLDHIESLGNNQYRIYEVEIDAKGNPISDVILRNGEHIDENGTINNASIVTINNNWDLYTQVFGGYNSLELGADGRLTWSENSIKLMVHAINNVGYRKNFDNLEGDVKEHFDTLTQGLDQDDVWQPLKYSDVHYTPNIGAIKSLQFNVNPDGEAVLEGKSELNFFAMRLAQLGIQLDKEHHADASDVSMPTQIIQACANRSFTSEYAKEIYTALATLTKQATKPFLDGIKGIITSNDPSKLVEEVTNLIIDNLLHQSSEDNSVNAILKDLMEKVEKGETLIYDKDIKGKIPWSDPTIMNKLFSSLSTTLTNLAVKMKFAGILSVICPTEGVEKIYGDRMLNSFTKIFDENGSTRTELSEDSLRAYQESVAAGNEVDSDGHNMLILDLARDSAEATGLDNEQSKKYKLSKVSELKTQHNYIIEFNDGTFEEVTTNVPEEYYRIKNLVLKGKTSDINIQDSFIPVRRIYENVEKGRNLGAYNVRYTDKNTGYRFQIYDLDSVNLLFNLNNLYTQKAPKGYKSFLEQTPEKQQQILNKIFKSSMFPKNAWVYLKNKYEKLPTFNENFITNLAQVYPTQLEQIINDLHKIIKPRVFKSMQNDLFKLSSNYSKPNRQVYANGQLIDPIDIQTDAYELIMPKIYQTQFGLQEFDDLQEILRDKDFFVKRGLSRFSCKLDHSLYDYELKNFNGEHYYVLDKSKGIPPELEQQVQSIFLDKKKGKTYRVDSDGHVMYELSSDKDVVCNLDGVQVIVTENPLFYVQNLNYNTLKVSPKRVTEESYQTLIGTLKESKRQNSKNFLKAISISEEAYFDLKTFKEFNKEIDELTYEKLRIDSSTSTQFKSTAQICRIILQNGRELHTAFDESLNLVAGRIPAQSQQSFMTQRVIGFDNSNVNTAMVSTFQLFLQGSDLDIDAVTLLGYEFDKNGKFVAWSPYFKSDSKENLEASKNIPLPTGEVKEIYAKADAPNNFFEIYDKYFGTLFKHISLGDSKEANIKTINGVPELQMDINTPEGLELLAEFLRDFNTYGINIKAPLIDGKIKANNKFFKAPERILNDGTIVNTEWNLFAKMPFGLNAGYDQTYEMAKQLLKFANDHNNYLNTAEEHLRDKMSKNYIVHYIYKVAEAPCNQTEAQESVDKSTQLLKGEAKRSAMATASDSYFPGRYVIKHKSVGEGQAGKAGVGIGAVGIKANSTTQFYISELLNYGSDKDQEKILFKNPVVIGGKEYRGFANMYTTKEADLEREYFKQALDYINQLEDPNEVTRDVAVNIAALLSIAVDNAKDLALAKINSGPRLMGMYAYGMTLGVPVEQLVQIMNSTEGRILTEMTEGSQFNNDITAFRILDVFDKLNGNIGGDLSQFDYIARDAEGNPIKVVTNINIKTQTPNGLIDKKLEYKSTQDALFASMYRAYEQWFKENNIQGHKAETFGGMVSQLIREGAFSQVYENSDKSKLRQFASNNLYSRVDEVTYKNWVASLTQMLNYIKDIESKSLLFKKSSIAKDLRTLAEGAEEMRILGSILSINKGLKATISDTETFIDTIENLIYDRKLASGKPAFESDKIDFHKFMTSKEYQDEVIEKYEQVKHSVNIPHLISKVQHFKGYLTTEIIPTSFFTTSSVKYRTLTKYRKNINADAEIPNANPQSLFTLFGVDSKRDKENILKGLENLIQFKLFTRWAYDNKLKFKVPKGFKYFDKKGHTTFNPNEEVTINLYTDYGLATFKKYMEEVYIPQLQNDPSCAGNEFVKNLTKISFDKTPLHNTVIAYSLQGDLMARKGRQAELNAKMFADFQSLSHYEFNSEISLPDAFYIYSQYCYMGKKGQKSLMSLFDNAQSRSSLCHSFNEHVAKMDAEGNISCSKEELIIWCAPVGNQHSKANYAYVTSNREFGVSLKQRIPEHVHLTEEEREALAEQQYENEAEEGARRPKAERFGVYKQEYIANQYDRLTRNHFLVPTTNDKVGMTVEMPMNMYGQDLKAVLEIKQDMILSIKLPNQLQKIIQTKIKDGQITKFDSVESFEKNLKDILSTMHIPYKVSLYKDQKQEIDFGILQTIIEQQINC